MKAVSRRQEVAANPGDRTEVDAGRGKVCASMIPYIKSVIRSLACVFPSLLGPRRRQCRGRSTRMARALGSTVGLPADRHGSRLSRQ